MQRPAEVVTSFVIGVTEVVNYPMWLLQTYSGSPARPIYIHNHGDSSPAPSLFIYSRAVCICLLHVQGSFRGIFLMPSSNEYQAD